MLAASSAVGAQSKLTIPPPTGVVDDFAHVLDQATIDRITRIAEDVRNKSRGEIAVVTLSDIGQNAPADVALQIGRDWKVGKIGNPGDATRNAGAVFPVGQEGNRPFQGNHAAPRLGAGAHR